MEATAACGSPFLLGGTDERIDRYNIRRNFHIGILFKEPVVLMTHAKPDSGKYYAAYCPQDH